MAKASGNTRTKYPSQNISEGITVSQYQSLVNAIMMNEIPDNDTWLELSTEQKEIALMEAGFTGVISDDIEDGTMYIPTTKESIIAQFQDTLVNAMQGYQVKDEFYTVLYKDGSKRYLNEMENDFAFANITSNMNKQAYTNAKNALQMSKVAAIIRSDAFDQPRFYVAKGGEQQMRDYGFEFWEGGRGEKKRNYIQDDWI